MASDNEPPWDKYARQGGELLDLYAGHIDHFLLSLASRKLRIAIRHWQEATPTGPTGSPSMAALYARIVTLHDTLEADDG